MTNVSITKFTYSSWNNNQVKLYAFAAIAASCIPLRRIGSILRREGSILRREGSILRREGNLTEVDL